MPSTPRIDYRNARHHVMNRGARRAPIFFDHECCGLFHSLLGELPARYNVVVHGYALMPNHFHLLLQTPNANLSRAMRFLCGQYARELNRTHEWDGPLFKGRFKNKVVEDQSYWRHLLAYIHLNPARAGLVSRVDESDWTSHTIYVGLEKPPAWLYMDEMLEIYGSPEAYYDYLGDLQHKRILAPDGFERAVLWTNLRTRGAKKGQEAPGAATVDETLHNALQDLQVATGLCRGDLLYAPRGRTGNRARWLTAWWLRRRDRMRGVEVARILGVSPARVCRMVKRAELAGEDEEPFASWMQAMLELEQDA